MRGKPWVVGQSRVKGSSRYKRGKRTGRAHRRRGIRGQQRRVGDEGKRKRSLKQFETAIIIFKTLCANFNKKISALPQYNHKTKLICIIQEEREAISTEKSNKVLAEGQVVQNHAG